jgi:tripartite motif-containing protein 71
MINKRTPGLAVLLLAKPKAQAKNLKSLQENGRYSARSRRIGVATAVLCLLFLAGTITIAHAETYTFILKWGSFGNEYSEGGHFHAPSGIAVDSFGNVYVSDTLNCRIQKFSSSGDFITKWGKWGYGSGDFRNPVGIAVDGSGNVYVADADNHIIQKFSSSGGFLAWGGYGSGNGQFMFPHGVAVDGSGNVYVADTQNDRIQKFSSTGVYLGKWGSVGNLPGELHEPFCIAVDSSGDNVYVTETNRNRVSKFSSSGVFLTQFSDGQEGHGDGQFDFPRGVAVDSLGNVYVADYNNDRVQKFSSSGVFLAKWGSFGNGDGQFGGPWGVAVDSLGNVYVTEWGNNRVQKFSMVPDFVVPEVPIGTTLVAVLAAFVGFTAFKRLHTKRQPTK